MGKSSKLCGCGDYTIMSTVFGCLMAVSGIVNIAAGEGVARFMSIWTIIMGLACAATIFLRSNILYRKITIGMFCLDVLFLVAQVGYFIYFCVELKTILPGFTEAYYNTYLTTFIAVSCVLFALRITFLALLGTCLVGGLRVELESQAQKANNAPSQPKQVVIAGEAVDVPAAPRDPANQINAI